MKLAIVIGRFQPLHNGHISLIKQAMEENDEVLVLVGSEGKLPDYRNPFDVETRKHFVEQAFPSSLVIRSIVDYTSDSDWIDDVTARALEFEENPDNITIYTSEKDQQFYESNFAFHTKVHNSFGLSATDIRTSWYNGTISDKVNEDVREFLIAYQGTEEYERLVNEWDVCIRSKVQAEAGHAFNNPIEPVVHAVVIQKGNLLLVRRGGVRGHGQLALPGGFLDAGESTRQGAVRELKEETSIDLMKLRAKEVAQAVEENMNGLSSRTLGINYAYLVHPEETLEPEAGDDASEVQWVPLRDVLTGDIPLFYNHTTIVRRLMSIAGSK